MRLLLLSGLVAPFLSLHLPPSHLSVCIHTSRSVAAPVGAGVAVVRKRNPAISLSAAAAPEPGEPEDETRDWEPPFAFSDDGGSSSSSSSSSTSPDFDMSALARRISSVQENDELRSKLEALPQAYVLVFNEDTDDETVYSMEVAAEGETPVVLAFECPEDASAYAVSLSQTEEVFEGEVASVQALDVEALVVTSRDADIRVAIVFKGDVEAAPDELASSGGLPLLITGAFRPPPVSVTITMVPDGLFSDKTSSDYLDPAEDPVWVLIHDEGTADAQFFSMTLNGTSSVVCFKDEEAAVSCSLALESKGASGRTVPSARSLLLGDLLETLGDEEVDVCLVDEVVETIIDDETQPGVVASDETDEVLGAVGGAVGSDSSASPASVRAMLNRILDDQDADDDAEGI